MTKTYSRERGCLGHRCRETVPGGRSSCDTQTKSPGASWVRDTLEAAGGQPEQV